MTALATSTEIFHEDFQAIDFYLKLQQLDSSALERFTDQDETNGYQRT
jgi:hypothetical protein